MSQQNVILTRQAHDAFTRRDIDAFLRILDPDVEMFISRLAPVEGESYMARFPWTGRCGK
jgi:ketosteroid isomerase-like protein